MQKKKKVPEKVGAGIGGGGGPFICFWDLPIVQVNGKRASFQGHKADFFFSIGAKSGRPED